MHSWLSLRSSFCCHSLFFCSWFAFTSLNCLYNLSLVSCFTFLSLLFVFSVWGWNVHSLSNCSSSSLFRYSIFIFDFIVICSWEVNSFFAPLAWGVSLFRSFLTSDYLVLLFYSAFFPLGEFSYRLLLLPPNFSSDLTLYVLDLSYLDFVVKMSLSSGSYFRLKPSFRRVQLQFTLILYFSVKFVLFSLLCEREEQSTQYSGAYLW